MANPLSALQALKHKFSLPDLSIENLGSVDLD